MTRIHISGHFFENRQRSGMTLIEGIVALALLIVIGTGLFGIFTSSQRLIYHSGSRFASSSLGRFAIESSDQLLVRADEDNCISNSSKCVDKAISLNRIDYNVNYTTGAVADPSGADTSLRKVVVNVTWNETR
jgi:type II secretory pathway pseudopilin PulG